MCDYATLLEDKRIIIIVKMYGSGNIGLIPCDPLTLS